MKLGINNDIENSSLASNIHLKYALPHVVYISKVVWFYKWCVLLLVFAGTTSGVLIPIVITTAVIIVGCVIIKRRRASNRSSEYTDRSCTVA